MPRITAESRDGRAHEVDVADGAALIDACDDHNLPIPFSCRSASCGTCRVQVLAGADDLVPPAADELDVLHVFDADPAKVRLTCQARFRPGAAHVHIRALED
jgi:ferredoxin